MTRVSSKLPSQLLCMSFTDNPEEGGVAQHTATSLLKPYSRTFNFETKIDYLSFSIPICHTIKSLEQKKEHAEFWILPP